MCLSYHPTSASERPLSRGIVVTVIVVAMLALLVAFMQVADTSHAGLPPSPVASIAVTPAHPVVTVGDSLRLKATPLDANGQPVPNASVRWYPRTYFEGTIDSTGMLHAGSPARFVIGMMAVVPGARP